MSGDTTLPTEKNDANNATQRLANVLLGKSDESLSAVLKDKPDLDAPITKNGLPPLHYAASKANNDWMLQLVQAGAKNIAHRENLTGKA